jgi:AcrR family transcriptional regulator
MDDRPLSSLTAAERARADILEVATAEFAEKSFSGARVDEIAAKTQTSKRMIYYYFGDKEGLFTAVLEREYLRIRAQEKALDVENLDPLAAMRKLVAATFHYHVGHEIFIRLVMVENIHRGEHLKTTKIAHSFGDGVLDQIEGIYQRGVRERVFRPGVTAIDIHLTISALSFHYIANRGTFSLLFDLDMESPEAVARRCEVVVDTVMRALRAD